MRKIILSIVIATNVLTNHEDCDLFDYVPIDSDYCPYVDYLGNLKIVHISLGKHKEKPPGADFSEF